MSGTINFEKFFLILGIFFALVNISFSQGATSPKEAVDSFIKAYSNR